MSLRLEPEGCTSHKGEDCPFCLRWERIIAATAASDDPKVRSWKDWEEAAYRKHLEEKAQLSIGLGGVAPTTQPNLLTGVIIMSPFSFPFDISYESVIIQVVGQT